MLINVDSQWLHTLRGTVSRLRQSSIVRLPIIKLIISCKGTMKIYFAVLCNIIKIQQNGTFSVCYNQLHMASLLYLFLQKDLQRRDTQIL